MAEAREQLIEILASPPDKRQLSNLEDVVSWIRRRVPILRNIDNSGLLEIIKNCQSDKVYKDGVIIQQGARTDDLYIILRGSALVYMDTTHVVGEDTWLSAPATPTVAGRNEETSKGKIQRTKRSERTKWPERTNAGKYIVRYIAGECFGQFALQSEHGIMSSTVVAEEACDLMVVDQRLFDTFIRSEQQFEYEELCNFISSHPYFTSLAPKFRTFLEVALRKETFPYDCAITRQGRAVTTMHFLFKGQANMYIEPHAYQKQYPKLWPFEVGTDLYCQEFEHLRKSRRNAILRKYKDPNVLATNSDHINLGGNVRNAAGDKKERAVCLCTVNEGEVLGDLEFVQNLDTYLFTVICTAQTTAFVLDIKNLEKLVGRRNQTVVEIMKEKAKEKLQRRATSKLGRDITFLSYLLFNITEDSLILQQNKTLPAIRMSKFLPGKEVQMKHLLEKFKNGRAQLIEPLVPGALIYKEQMQDKARIRAKLRYRGLGKIRAKLREVRQKIAKRYPRSRYEIVKLIRESLKSRRPDYTQTHTKSTKFKKYNQVNQNKPRTAAGSNFDEDLSKGFRVKSQMNNKATNTEESRETSENNIVPSSEVKVCSVVIEEHPHIDTDYSQFENKNRSRPQTGTATDRREEAASEPHLGTASEMVDSLDVGEDQRLNGLHRADEENNSCNPLTITLNSRKVNVSQSQKPLVKLPPLVTPSLEFDIQKGNVSQCENSFVKLPHLVTPRIELDIQKGSVSQGEKSLVKLPPPLVTSSFKLDIQKEDVSQGEKLVKLPPLVTPSLKLDIYKSVSQSEKSLVNIPPLVTPGLTLNTQKGVSLGEKSTVKLPPLVKSSVNQMGRKSTTKWDLAKRFVNTRAANRSNLQLLPIRHNFDDYETSDSNLLLLENRIKAFFVQNGKPANCPTIFVPRLRRFNADLENALEGQPRPGGKVWVRKRLCHYADSTVQLSDHEHIRHHIVAELPQFRNVQKARVILHHLLSGAL